MNIALKAGMNELIHWMNEWMNGKLIGSAEILGSYENNFCA